MDAFMDLAKAPANRSQDDGQLRQFTSSAQGKAFGAFP